MPTYGLYLSTLVLEFIGIYVRKLSNFIVCNLCFFIFLYKFKSKRSLYWKAKWSKKFTNKSFGIQKFSKYLEKWKYINSTLDEILRSQIFANQQITRTSTKEAIKIRIHSVNPQVLDTFLNKILNKQLIIKKLELNTNFIDLEVGSK